MKNGTKDGHDYSTNHVFVTPTNLLTWAGFTLIGAPGTWGILQHLPAKVQVKTKKSNHQSAGPLSVCHEVNPPMGITLRSQKG